MWPKVRFVAPFGFGLAALVAGAVCISYTSRLLANAGIKPDDISHFQAAEFQRWMYVTLVVVILTSVVGLIISFRKWRGPVVAVIKVVLLASLIVISATAAYWSDRDAIASGLFVHPPGLAIYVPPLCGVLAVLIFCFWRGPNRKVKRAGA